MAHYGTRAGRRICDLTTVDTSIAALESDVAALEAVDTAAAAAWTPYTPIVTAASGTLGTHSATGSYKTIGKTTHFRLSIAITANGTGSGFISASLPNTAVAEHAVSGRENATTFRALAGRVDAGATVSFNYYDNTYPGANGTAFLLSGVYENT